MSSFILSSQYILDYIQNEKFCTYHLYFNQTIKDFQKYLDLAEFLKICRGNLFSADYYCLNKTHPRKKLNSILVKKKLKKSSHDETIAFMVYSATSTLNSREWKQLPYQKILIYNENGTPLKTEIQSHIYEEKNEYERELIYIGSKINGSHLGILLMYYFIAKMNEESKCKGKKNKIPRLWMEIASSTLNQKYIDVIKKYFAGFGFVNGLTIQVANNLNQLVVYWRFGTIVEVSFLFQKSFLKTHQTRTKNIQFKQINEKKGTEHLGLGHNFFDGLENLLYNITSHFSET